MSSPYRRPLLVGNWKMNKTLAAAVETARGLLSGLPASLEREAALCPPFTALSVVGEILKGTPVRLGAQNLHPKAHGAFTGEISAQMLLDVGCRFVIVGHSERRKLLGESDAFVGEKAAAALAAGLEPIACVGETLEERESHKTFRVIETQLREIVKAIAPVQAAHLVVAYEPVWAIGTGRNATPAQAQEVHLFIRKKLAEHLGKEGAESVRILYGGSVKPDNIDSLMAEPDVDGALVGGESLKADSFLKIVQFRAAGSAARASA